MRLIVLFGCAAALSVTVVGVVLAAEASDEKGPEGLGEILVPADPITVNSVPSPRQLVYQTNQYGAFLHYGPAVFLDGDWKSTPDRKIFNPTQLDVEQWVRVAKSFDAKHIVFSAKHHNGYCLWPTGTTDYSVREFTVEGRPGRRHRGPRHRVPEARDRFGVVLLRAGSAFPVPHGRPVGGQPSNVLAGLQAATRGTDVELR